MLARAAELGGCSLSDTMQTIEVSGGAPLVIVMQETTRPLHNGLIVRPDMTGDADIKGKTIMLGGPIMATRTAPGGTSVMRGVPGQLPPLLQTMIAHCPVRPDAHTTQAHAARQ